jgi:signal transduction histidine kinase
MKTTDTRRKESMPARSERGTLLSDISHDLKSYLNPIIGFSSVLLQDEQRLKADQLKQVRTIYESAKKLLDRIDALVLLLRLGEHYQPVKQTVSVIGFLQEQIELMREEAAARNVRLELACEEPLKVETDPLLLGRGLKELLAYLIGRLGGGNVALSCRKEKTEVVLTISCPVLSLSPKEGENWRAFLQSSDYLASAVKGIGLWLALARQAVAQANGRLEFTGENNWKISLPLK